MSRPATAFFNFSNELYNNTVKKKLTAFNQYLQTDLGKLDAGCTGTMALIGAGIGTLGGPVGFFVGGVIGGLFGHLFALGCVLVKYLYGKLQSQTNTNDASVHHAHKLTLSYNEPQHEGADQLLEVNKSPLADEPLADKPLANEPLLDQARKVKRPEAK